MAVIFKVVAIGVVAGVLVLAMRKYSPEMAMQVSVAAGVILFLLTATQLGEAVAFIKRFAGNFAGFSEGITTVLKVVGIAYLAEFTGRVLKDAEMAGLAGNIEMAAKVIIMVLTLPLIEQFATTVLGILA